MGNVIFTLRYVLFPFQLNVAVRYVLFHFDTEKLYGSVRYVA